GDCCDALADFNIGSKIVVAINIDSGTTAAPACVSATFTGETNSLSLAATPALSTMPVPRIEFAEKDPLGSADVPATCSTSTGNDEGINVVYRWYNQQTKDHFYTLDPGGEGVANLGYVYEGVRFGVFDAGTPGTKIFLRWKCPPHHYF